MRNENFLRFVKKTTRVIVSCLFIFSLFLSAYADKKQCEWDNIKKIVAVGDLHGDYDNCVKILKTAGLVDDTLKWIGGDTHLVQTGDIMDRGDYAKEILDLIMKLEVEAEEAGGKVHMLIGNHEELNITGMALGTPGYVSKIQFLAFLTESLREKMEKEFKKLVEKSLKEGNNSSAAITDIEEWWSDQITRDRRAQYEYTVNFNDDYGKWIIEQNAVIRINDVIFVHGGISERFSTWPLEKINDTFREELNIYRLAYKRGRLPMGYKPEIVYAPDAPHWFRDFVLKDEKYFTAEANKIL
ncbi:MAG: metallophosphoesterase, partial [Candidatus Aminicenantes bacterium]|nr:metallophosphoesterase [Candidatus Aminicenantes bacterium]